VSNWEVPSVVAGVDDWPKRWCEKAEQLARVDWPNFRRNYALMEGMQDPPSKLAAWLKRTRALGIEDADLVEPEFGNPEGGVHSQRGVLTAVGARHGYYARQIFARAGGDVDGAHLLEIGGGFGGLVRALHRIPGAGGVGRRSAVYRASDALPPPGVPETPDRRLLAGSRLRSCDEYALPRGDDALRSRALLRRDTGAASRGRLLLQREPPPALRPLRGLPIRWAVGARGVVHTERARAEVGRVLLDALPWCKRAPSGQ